MQTPLAAFRSAPLERVQLGTELTYRRFGQGPAVVLVHGWPLNGATYRGLVPVLAQHFTCYVPDLPGSGQTPWDPAITDIFEDWGKLIADFVQALGLSRVALIGHDSGGGIARVSAALLGERVTMLGLIDTEVSNHKPGLVWLYQQAARIPGSQALFGALLKQRWYRRSQLGLGKCFQNVDHIDGEFHEACVVPLYSHLEWALQAISRADSSGSQLPALHARITAPTVLVWGENDGFFPVAKARAMLPEFRDVRAFDVLPGQGLFVHDEAPQLVAEKLLPWLQKLHAPAATTRLASA